MSKEFSPVTPSQKLVMEDQSPCLLYCGPWFSGKTHIGAVKAYVMGALYQQNVVALVRKKQVDLRPTLWKKFIEEAVPEGAIIESNDTTLYRKIANGTEFFGIGLDSTHDVNKLASREYGMIVVEEITEITEEDFDKKILRCLRLPRVPFHQMLGLTNANAPSHWLYKRFYLEPPEGYKAINGEMLPNPPASYSMLINQLTGIMKKRYVDNEWVSLEGMVYPFNPVKHIVPRDRCKISKEGRWVISVDFGFDHPFICQFWYVSPEDIWFLYWQIYMSYRIVRVHAEEIKKRCFMLGIEASVVCDHDAEDAATLRDCGIKTTPAQKARLAGQQAVYEKFENDKLYFLADSLIELDQRLMMLERPTKTEEEFPTYVWANSSKEDMCKEKDDGVDAMRYAIYSKQDAIIRLGKVYV